MPPWLPLSEHVSVADNPEGCATSMGTWLPDVKITLAKKVTYDF
jgi:hypothetical protein